MNRGVSLPTRTADQPARAAETTSISTATVCVIESQTAIRELIANYLRQLQGVHVAQVAGTFDEGLRACATLRPHLAVVDGYMWSETQGISLSRAIPQVSPGTKVLIFCSSAHPDIMRDAVDAHVPGFVLRSEPAAVFEKAIRAVIRGEQFYSSEITQLLRQHRRRPQASPDAPLSPRERQVLQEIARGRLSKEIADLLGMSVFGVQNVRRRISRKTGLRTIAQLTLHAAKLRLVPGHDASE